MSLLPGRCGRGSSLPQMNQPRRYSSKNWRVTGMNFDALVVPDVRANIKTFVPGANIAPSSPRFTRSMYGR